jgi:cell division protein FtsL
VDVDFELFVPSKKVMTFILTIIIPVTAWFVRLEYMTKTTITEIEEIKQERKDKSNDVMQRLHEIDSKLGEVMGELKRIRR